MKTEKFQYIINGHLESMYQEWKSVQNITFIDWCNSTNGKIYLAELILQDIEMIGGINICLNSRVTFSKRGKV